METSITIDALETLFQLTIQKLKLDNISAVSWDINYYWQVCPDEAKNMSIEPTLAVGSLDDDLMELNKSLHAREITSYVDFDRLASILNFISDTLAPPKLLSEP